MNHNMSVVGLLQSFWLQETKVQSLYLRHWRQFRGWFVAVPRLCCVNMSLVGYTRRLAKMEPNPLFVPTPGTMHHVSCYFFGGRGTTTRYVLREGAYAELR